MTAPTNAKSSLRRSWDFLVGSPEEFGHDVRMLNGVCIITGILLLIVVLFNSFIGLIWLSLFINLSMVMLGGAYYLSRVRRDVQLGVTLYAFGSYIVLIVNYFFNSGMEGPTLIIFFLTFAFLIAISATRLHVLWVSLHLLIPVILIWIEHARPDLVPYTYSNSDHRVLDHFFSYFICLMMIYSVTRFMRSSLIHERYQTLLKSEDIERQNVMIRRQNMDLERLNEEKNKIFSIVSHDLRVPLASIQNYLELLQETSLDEEESQQIESQLLNQTREVTTMLTNLLVWAKAQMQGLQVNYSNVSLKHVVGEVLKVLQPIAQNKGISIEDRVGADLNVWADVDLTQHVIRNLISNAIKFTPSGGNVFIWCAEKDNEVILSVADTGVGVSKERQDQIFGMRDASTAGTQNEKGLGLGLFLSRDFMERQHGRIWFESEVGKGSVFNIVFKKDRSGAVLKA